MVWIFKMCCTLYKSCSKWRRAVRATKDISFSIKIYKFLYNSENLFREKFRFLDKNTKKRKNKFEAIFWSIRTICFLIFWSKMSLKLKFTFSLSNEPQNRLNLRSKDKIFPIEFNVIKERLCTLHVRGNLKNIILIYVLGFT